MSDETTTFDDWDPKPEERARQLQERVFVLERSLADAISVATRYREALEASNRETETLLRALGNFLDDETDEANWNVLQKAMEHSGVGLAAIANALATPAAAPQLPKETPAQAPQSDAWCDGSGYVDGDMRPSRGAPDDSYRCPGCEACREGPPAQGDAP